MTPRLPGWVGGLFRLVDLVVALIGRNQLPALVVRIVGLIADSSLGVIDLPFGTTVLVVVAAVPLASWLILRRLGSLSTPVWLASTAAAVLVAIEVLSPGTLRRALTHLTGPDVAPLLVVVAGVVVYLWWRSRQSAASTPETVNRLIFRSDE